MNNLPLDKFGSIQVTRAMSGLGISGVCTTQLTFTTPAPFYASRAATVKLSGVGGLPTFYISQRSVSKGIVTVTCLDKTAFLDEPFPIDDFTTAGDDIPLSQIMTKIVSTVGFSGWGAMCNTSFNLSTTSLQGVTCLDILNRIATACVGVWWCNPDENLQLVTFPNLAGGFRVEEHTAVDFGCEYSPTGVHMVDGRGNVHSRGSGMHKYDTISVESDLITSSIADEVYNRIKNRVFKSFVCEKCKLYSPEIPAISSMVSFKQFDDGSVTGLQVNNIVASINSQGIFATLRFNEPNNDEIGLRGKLTSSLDNKVHYGEYGNDVVFTKYQGIMYKEEPEPEE